MTAGTLSGAGQTSRKPPRHGISRYRAGCRCALCRGANAARVARNRARRAADPDRLTHGTRSAYDAGCRCQPCSDERRIAYMKNEGGYREHWWRRVVTETYRAARDAWAALRESKSALAWSVAGAANSNVGCAQLGDDEFRQLHPPPVLRDVLCGLRASDSMYLTL